MENKLQSIVRLLITNIGIKKLHIHWTKTIFIVIYSWHFYFSFINEVTL